MSLPPEMIGSLFELSREPVLGVNAGGTIVFANPAASALLGVRAGDSAAGILPAHILEDPAEQFIASVRLGERHANVSVRRTEDVMVCAWSMRDSGPPSLTRGKSLEELSSRLMTARMAIDALVRGTHAEDNAATSETVRILYQEYYRLQRLCQHMRLADSIQQGSLPMLSGVTDLGTLCRELCDTAGMFFSDRGVALVFEADLGLHLTMADSGLLECMLSNILTNSLAHCKAGDAVHVKLTRQGERFIIAVQDNGEGIPPDKMARLFNGEPTADNADPTAGVGQGLLIARGIAERHGGAVIMDSRPGQGANVRISIPYKKCDDLQLKSPPVRYRSDGMNTVLTEFSLLADKKYYTRRMFD